MTYKKTDVKAPVRDDFRHITTTSGKDLTVCGDCLEITRKVTSVIVAMIPSPCEALECECCSAINSTMALSESIEILAYQDAARQRRIEHMVPRNDNEWITDGSDG